MAQRFKFEKQTNTKEQLSENLGGVRSLRLAFDTKTASKVLVDAINEESLADEALFRFQQENRRIQDISCPSLWLPIDHGVEDGIVFSVFENRRHERLLDLAGSLSLERKIELAIELTEGVSAVHELGIVHRNIHSSSILVFDGAAQLGGLGVERYLNPSVLCDEKSLRFAKYSSPEMAGSLVCDIRPASDLYSIGAIFFHLFTGSAPFLAESVSEVLFQHLTVDPQFGQQSSNLPSAIVDIISSLLRKDPPERYQTADSLGSDLRNVLELVRQRKSTKGFVLRSREVKPAVSDPAFVGRQAEFDALAAELTKINNEEVRKVLVSCPSGIGKSRLILEFMRHAGRKNVNVLCGRGSNEAGREPMGPLLDVIKQLSERLDGNPIQRTCLQDRLAGEEAEIATVCPEIAEALGWGLAHSKLGPDEFGQNRIEMAIGKLIANAASPAMPLMIWVDDCQWLDEQTLRILSIASELNTKCLLFLFSMRSENADVVETFCEQVQLDRRIELGPLTDEEVCLLQQSMTGPLPDVAAKTVVKHAAGSPFMAAAVIRGMFESNSIKLTSEGKWKIDEQALARIQAADDAAQVLVQRLEQLPPSTLRLLSIAALIGKEFDVQSVFEICELSELGEHLDIAQQNRLVWSMPNGSFSFVHDKIRETLLRRLSADEKRELHLSLAEYFEANRPLQVFDIAFHFERAKYPGRGLNYAIEAAKIARKRFALGEAEDQLKIALSGLANSCRGTKYEVYSSFADVTMLDGRYDQAEEWLDQASAFAETGIEKAHAVLAKGELEFKRGNKEGAVDCFEFALRDLGYRTPKLVSISLFAEVMKQSLHTMFPKLFVGRKLSGVREASGADQLACKLFSRLAHGYWYTRDKYQTLWSHLRGMNIAESFPVTPELAQAYSEHAPTMSLLPWHSRGLKYADHSLALREEFGDVWGQGQSRNFKSILLYSASQFENAITQSRRAITVLERTGDYWEVHIARYQLAASHYRLGDLKSAVREAQEAYKSALELEDYQTTGIILDVWGRASQNQIPTEIIEQERVRPLGDVQGRCQVLLADGVWNFRNGDYQIAADRFREAIMLAKKVGVVNTYITPNFPWLATALRLLHENPKLCSIASNKKTAKQFLRAAKQAVRVGKRFQNELPHALRELGLAYAVNNKSGKAKRALLESVEVAQKQGATYELAKSKHAMADLKAEFDWKDVEFDSADTEFELNEIENQVKCDQSATSLSIWDRFENLLDAGQQISRATSKHSIERICIESANLLLRGQRSVLLYDLNTPDESITEFEFSLAQRSAQENAAIVCDRESLSNEKSHQCNGSYLACPIAVKGEISAVLLTANDAVLGLFAEPEKRIAEFLSATAGAAFEKAENFGSLQEMNKELEARVVSRTALIGARSKELEKTADTLRETQRSLERALDSAEKANNTKSAFLARMSHEIRTPIAAINGFAELLLRGIVPPEQRNEKLATILDSGKHLLRLINNLLDLSKVEADQFDMELTEVKPVELVHGVLESLRSKAVENLIELELEIVGSIPSLILTDETRVRQVLTNLVGNAIKFTMAGFVKVEIGMAVDATDPAPETSKKLLCIDVTDSGIGMTEEQLEKIFDPFTQADTSVTRRFGGTGLGLSISKKIVEELGGNIEATSSVNVGSRFRMILDVEIVDGCQWIDENDIDVSSTNLDALEEWHPIELDGRRVLIVDDVSTNREYLKLILGPTNAELSFATNGLEAVSAVEREDYDLVLMDMQMPIMDGYSATRRIREVNQDVPIIALTANSMKDDERKCLNVGCSDYCSKPIDTVSLLQKIKQHIPTNESTVETDTTFADEDSTSVSTGRQLADTEIFGDGLAALRREYVQGLVPELVQYRKQLDDQNFEQILSLGHAMKGTAAMVGLSELSDAGIRLESAGRDLDLALATEAVAEIESLVDAALIATNPLVPNG